ncbi:MAG: tetratricopeptide repeat protein [Cyanobacteria bacterium SZAS-4]|nr:tetratricopeptide repeat protein [Cyanobacteria bacterium SZAS-4]
MFRPGSLVMTAALSCVAAINCSQNAIAQSSQFPAQNNQLALSAPNATSGLQMLRSDASVLFSAGQYEAAAEAYKRLLQLGSMEASDRYWLGESLYHAKNYLQAATAFEQAVQLNSKLTQAYVRLAETYLALHQKEKALQTCTNGLSIVTDPYIKELLSNLLKVAMYQEHKRVHQSEVRVGRMPSES